MSGYMGMSDVAGDCPSEQGTCAVKFCSLGFVTSSKWVGVYIVIADGNLRVYDSENTYLKAPLSFAQDIHLTRYHNCSPVKRKEYSQNGGKPVDFFSFYLEVDNGALASTRVLKIGCLDYDQAKRMIECIQAASSAQ